MSSMRDTAQQFFDACETGARVDVSDVLRAGLIGVPALVAESIR